MAGKVGRELTVEEGYQVARNVGLNCLATVKRHDGGPGQGHAGGETAGMVHCTEDFKDQPKVINGAQSPNRSLW